jgi:hypothetical protein
MPFQFNWAFFGSCPKQFHLQMKFPFWVFIGTYQIRQWKLRKRRRKSTKKPSKDGHRIPLTPCMISRSCMVNCFMPALWCQLGMLTSPASRPCWAHSWQVLLFWTTHLKKPTMTSAGSSTPSALQNLLAESLVHVSSQTAAHFQMPARESASPSSLQAVREPGGSSWDGRPKAEISVGPKQLVSNSWSMLSSQLVNLTSISDSLRTTGALLRDCGRVWAETSKTLSLGKSTTSFQVMNALLSHATSQAKKTQQMPLPEASSHLTPMPLLLHPHCLACNCLRL